MMTLGRNESGRSRCQSLTHLKLKLNQLQTSFLFKKRPKNYIMDYVTPPEKLKLGDSCGIPIVIACEESWTVASFHQNHSLQPSTHFMLDLKV